MNLRDLQEQIEGEAHFMFSGNLVRGDMFYANPSLKKSQLRIPQLLQFPNEDADRIDDNPGYVPRRKRKSYADAA